MQGISRIARVATVSLLVGGCFPAVDNGDVTEADVADSSGQDTSAAGDTTPQDDTIAPPDTGEDTASVDTSEVDTTPPECEGPEDCQHLAGTCTKVVCLNGTCAAQPDNGASCDDGEACTKGDVCSGFTCAGTGYSCDDGETCTDDVCDGEGGCDYPAKDGACWIAGQCYTVGETKPGDACRICEGGETWSANDGATCDDGDDVCTLGDTCDGMTCVGGPGPDDSAGDWARSPIQTTGFDASDVTSLISWGQWLFYGGSYEEAATIVGPGDATASGMDAGLGRAAVIVQEGTSGLAVRMSVVPARNDAHTSLARAGNLVAAAAGLGNAGVVDIDGLTTNVSEKGVAVTTLDPLVFEGAVPWFIAQAELRGITADAGRVAVSLDCRGACEVADSATTLSEAGGLVVVLFTTAGTELWHVEVTTSSGISTNMVQAALLPEQLSVVTFAHGDASTVVVDGVGATNDLSALVAPGRYGYFDLAFDLGTGALESATLVADFAFDSGQPSAGPTLLVPRALLDHVAFANGDLLSALPIGVGSGLTVYDAGQPFWQDTVTATGDLAYLLLRHDLSGNVSWVRASGGPGGGLTVVAAAGDDTLVATECCANGDGFVSTSTGQSDPLGNTGAQGILTRLDPSGVALWTRFASNAKLNANTVGAGTADDVYVGGWFAGAGTSELGSDASPLPVVGSGDYNSVLMRLNSSHGLECIAP